MTVIILPLLSDVPIAKSRSTQCTKDGRHFAEDIFNFILLGKICCILIHVSMRIVPKGPIHNKPALVQTMVRRQTGVYPSEHHNLLTHICVIYTTYKPLCCPFMYSVCSVASESPRWLYAQKRRKEADSVMARIARWNKCHENVENMNVKAVSLEL